MTNRKKSVIFNLLILIAASSASECDNARSTGVLDEQLKKYVDGVLSVDNYDIVPGVYIERSRNLTVENGSLGDVGCGRGAFDIQNYVYRKLDQYSQTHVLAVNIPATARFFKVETGKSSFLAGFGMGFLAFALKKLLLPVFIGAQLIKSVLIAMFLPSILGSLGKLVGKGLSTFSGVSGASTGINNNNHVEDFEFKDTGAYNNEDNVEFHDDGLVNAESSTVAANSRFGMGGSRVSYVSPHNSVNENYYIRKPSSKKTDYKVFHKIPSSSLLLTSYDPFYSPLLSRLDAVFQQLGLANDKSLPETERCRERLICMMYANPAKYAPYSNLVSAQLSRELNELRKPSSDNPDILRFFKYMKAAKDGQDGEECLAHGGCPNLSANAPSPAMLTTFNDINKLVQARKLQ
ncbi:uncharacterized protein LOC109606352 [Aethina tumida]|uniref:uncharacterized protein LOC109606352 n=1 Tax=Aethina tumida TaxID=116153 RepID=UPI00214777A5|nr:uncharacterized protein LOC109606352 [Aethina tumida]